MNRNALATTNTLTTTNALTTAKTEQKKAMPATLKRLLAPLFVLMVLLSTVAPAPALAATPTTSNLGYSTVYVRRGGSYNFRFCVRSNSYSRRLFVNRTRFKTDMYKYSSGRRVDSTAWQPVSGTTYFNARYKFSRSRYSRNSWYELNYKTQYRSGLFGRWYTSTSRYIDVHVS